MSISIDDFKRIYAEVTEREADAVTAEASFEQLNIDSLIMMEIIGQVEDDFGIELDEDSLVDIKTVQDLLNLCAEAGA